MIPGALTAEQESPLLCLLLLAVADAAIVQVGCSEQVLALRSNAPIGAVVAGAAWHQSQAVVAPFFSLSPYIRHMDHYSLVLSCLVCVCRPWRACDY